VISGRRVLCIIPARGGSKGVPGKNLRPLGGRPLIAHTFDHALGCAEIDRTVVSTDSLEIAAFARDYGMDVPFMRPAELASDSAGTIEVLLHAMDFVEAQEGAPYDIVLLLHATAPLRLSSDASECLRLVADEGAESAFTVGRSHGSPYFNMVELDSSGRACLAKGGAFSRRQDAPPVYDINGGAYAWSWTILRQKRAVVLPGSRVHVMPRERSVDIDDELDLLVAECLLASSLPRLDGETEGLEA